MQTVHKILMGNTIFIMLMVLVAILIITAIYSISYTFNASALPYAWDTTQINTPLTWIKIPLSSMTLFGDINQDGTIDNIYQLSGTTVTRIWGTHGVSSFTIDGGTPILFYIKQNRILAGNQSATNCISTFATQWNATDGTRLQTHAFPTGAGTGIGVRGGLINVDNRTAYACGASGTNNGAIEVHDSPNVNFSGASAGTVSASQGKFHIGLSAVGITRVYEYTNVNWVNTTASYHSARTAGGLLTGISTSFPDIANYQPDPNVIEYQRALLFPYAVFTQNFTASNFITSTKLIERQTLDPTDKFLQLINIYPQIFNDEFTTPPRYFLMNNGTQFLGAIVGTNVYYINYNTLLQQFTGNRALTNYRIDAPLTWDDTLITNALPTTLLDLIYPNQTIYANTAQLPQSIIPSGYHFKIPALNRNYYPQWDNSTSPIPIRDNTGSHTPLTLEIKNPFPETAIRLRDSGYYNSTIQWIWLVDSLQTDNTITFDMVINQCVNVDIKDSDTPTNQWVDLGFFCHNGLTYKILPNTSELSFQFWAFPYGVNHIFNNTSNLLQTQVRHTTTPYLYVLKLIDKNDVIVYDQIINSSTAINLQSVNATNFTKPIFLSVLDYQNANNTLYHATLGFPSYLSSITLFTNQYLTKDGFSLVMLMPLIFAAMFTRNTVGIGTILTVVFIATMSWMGVIPIPDLILYAMFIFAAIGLIAYKTAGY